jgi:hypothetical protein
MAMRSLVVVLALCSLGALAASQCEAQTTYTWTGNFNQEWTAPGNWLPPRTDPDARDILQFDESATVTKAPTEVIGKLVLLNNASVTLQAEHAGNELAIATPVLPVTGLDVQSGCTLTTGSPGLKLTLGTDVSAEIDGTLALGAVFTNTVTTTVDGTLQFNLGGSWSGNPPDYGDNSTLKYSSTGTFSRGDEWSATSSGYPANVQISNGTTLDLAGVSGAATTRQMSGDLTIDPGSKLGMNESGHVMTGNLKVAGNVVLGGTLELGMGSLSSETGSIEVGGDWTISPGGTFLIGPSSRYDARVTFNGSGTQLISATGELNFPSIFIDKTYGNVELACDARLNAWIVTALGMEHGDLDLNGNKLSVSRGEAWFVANNEEHSILGPGTVYFDVGGPGTHGNGSLVFDEGVTVTCCGGIGAMDAPVTINGVLESRCGALVAGGVPLYYGPNSLLLYRIDDFFNRGAGMEWSEATGPGAPMDVQITVTPGHTGTLGLNSWSWQTNTVPHGVRGDFTIDPGCKFIIGSGLPVSVQGNVTVAGELDLYNLPVNGGLEVGRHWTLDGDGTFVPNGVQVVFNGSQQSSVTGETTFDKLTVDNAAGVLLNSDINVNQGLTLTNGDLDLNGHTVSKVSGTVVDVVVSNGARTISGPGTVFWEGMSLAGSGSLVIPEGVLLSCGSSASITASVTINGVLESRGGPIWSGTGPVPITYGANSLLRYKVDGINRGAGMEWSEATGPGAPVRVDITTTPMHSGTLSLIEWPWQADVTPHGVRGNLMIGPGCAFNQNSNLPLTVQGNVSVIGAMGFTGDGDLELAGNWSLSGTFSPGDHLVTFNGSAPQTITGLTTFDNLAVDNAAGVVLNSDITVNQVLTFTSGKITTGAEKVVVGTTGSISGATEDRYVVGNLQLPVAIGTAVSKAFPIGDVSNYAPVVAVFDTVTTAGNLTASTTGGDHPDIASSTIIPTLSVNRFWTLTNGDVGFDHCDATFNFQPGDMDAGADTSSFIVALYDSGWSYPTVGTKKRSSTQATGLTTFGDFAVGEGLFIPLPACLTGPAPFGTGGEATSVAIGDLDHDGSLDLVTANNWAGSVSVLLGNGDGTFGEKTDIPVVGHYPLCVAIGDLDEDGIPDLAVTNDDRPDSSKVSVLLGEGDGTFGVSTDFVGGLRPVCLAIGDLNGDTSLDLVATSDVAMGMVWVLLGNGDGTFGEKTDIPVGGPALCVAIGDLNGDTIPDLVTTTTLPYALSVLLGRGDGTFWDRTDYPAGGGGYPGGPIAVAIGDLNGDGVPDLAVANCSQNLSGTVSVFLGRGDGTFEGKTDFEVGLYACSVVIGDLNGDEIPDLAVNNPDYPVGTVSVLLGNGDGTFAAETDYYSMGWSHGGGGAMTMVIGDMNLDGNPDLATIDNATLSLSDDTVSVLLNCTDLYAASVAPLPPPPPLSFQFLAPWPNPTRGASEIRFLLPAACTVDVALYNVAGRKVRSLASGELTTPGEHTIRWDGRDSSGALVGSGVYLVKVRAGGDEGVRKLVILR